VGDSGSDTGRMKLLFDQNLSHRLLGQLAAEFPASSHVREVGLVTAPDPDLWAYAASNGFAIVSKDTDFQQRALLFGHPPKVIWVRLGNCTTAAVASLLRSRLADILAFEGDPVASFLALS
jgi:predicted nuclease of predicted toxin-antitoxin system